VLSVLRESEKKAKTQPFSIDRIHGCCSFVVFPATLAFHNYSICPPVPGNHLGPRSVPEVLRFKMTGGVEAPSTSITAHSGTGGTSSQRVGSHTDRDTPPWGQTRKPQRAKLEDNLCSQSQEPCVSRRESPKSTTPKVPSPGNFPS
jgi:hypothetical protein